MQQKGLLIGLGVGLGAFLVLARRRGGAPQKQAARKLVRDWRKVDDVDDARELLSEHLPTIAQPILLTLLDALEDQVHVLFRRLERQIEHL